MQWSHYSEAIFDMFANTSHNIIVQACPGAGKTTNIAHMWSLTDKSTCYLVFNKHNQIEAQAKLFDRPGSAVLTLNSLGHRAIMATYGRVQLDDRKVYKLIKQHIPFVGMSYKERQETSYTLYKAVQVAKMIDTDGSLSAQQLDSAIDTYDLESYHGMYADVIKLLDISDNTLSVIDFADQIRLPAISNAIHMPQYDIILGDEVQDFSPVQAQMISRMHSRYVLVGDSHQSIYGFRGAMSNSMTVLKRMFGCAELPLSITYRCATDIVDVARAIYPDIEAWEQSPQGKVWQWPADIPEKTQGEDILIYDTDTLVLCRNNKPLIDLAFSLLADGIPCHVRGRDIGDGLVKLIKKQECSTIRQLIDSLTVWQEAEQQRSIAKDDDSIAQRAYDKVQSILVFTSKCKMSDHPDCAIELIDTLFDQGKGCCLSTVHKAKGLEAHRCYLLQSDLFNRASNKAKLAWQKEQERNILYVAVTRAKEELVYM